MARVHEVRLELVRPGPPHNQLLSPLTPYMALCGEGSPITFHIDFEHRQLLNRLERLRYVSADANGAFVRVPERLREAQVQELGEEMGRLLGRIPSLITELIPVRSNSARGRTSCIYDSCCPVQSWRFCRSSWHARHRHSRVKVWISAFKAVSPSS